MTCVCVSPLSFSAASHAGQQSPLEKHRQEKGSEIFRALAGWLTGRYWNVEGSLWPVLALC